MTLKMHTAIYLLVMAATMGTIATNVPKAILVIPAIPNRVTI